MRQKVQEKRRFWKSLPRTSAYRLAVAVFCTSAATGFVNDLFRPGRLPFLSVIAWSLYGGLGGVSFLFTVMRRPRLLFALVAAFAASIFVLIRVLPVNAHAPDLQQDVQTRLILDATIILVAIYSGYSFFLSFIETEGLKHLRNQTELELAERLQTTLVPPLHLAACGVEVEARSIPSSSMGGDLADALVTDGCVACYVADVSGHGVAAGVLMGMVKTGVRMELLRGATLDVTLNALHRVLPGVKDESSFVTFAGIRFLESQAVEYSTAGHAPILHYHAETREIDRLFIEQFPLGLISGSEFRSATAECGPNDLFVMLTDGIIEAVNLKDEDFGLDRVELLLKENATRALPDIASAIIEAVSAYGPRADDQTILIARAVEAVGPARIVSRQS